MYKKMNRKNIQRALFLAILANCCLVIVITSVALSTENWVIVRPYRQQPAEFPSTNIKLNKEDVLSVLMNHKHNSSLPYSVINETLFKANILLKDKNDTDYLLDISGLSEELDDEDDVLPIDLYATKDCVRYKGKIKLGLFKGVWLLNYAFGCKNRINRVSSINSLFLNRKLILNFLLIIFSYRHAHQVQDIRHNTLDQLCTELLVSFVQHSIGRCVYNFKRVHVAVDRYARSNRSLFVADRFSHMSFTSLTDVCSR